MLGLLPVYGAYYVQTKRFDIVPIVPGAIIAILIFLVILAILILIVSKIAPEMAFLSEKIEGLGL